MQTVSLELHKNWRKFGIGPKFFLDFFDIEKHFFRTFFVIVIKWKELSESDLGTTQKQGKFGIGPTFFLGFSDIEKQFFCKFFVIFILM